MYIIRNHFFFRCCVENISFLSFVSCALFPRHPLCIYLCMYLSIYSIVYHPLFVHFEIIPPPPISVFCIFVFTKPKTIFCELKTVSNQTSPQRTILYVYIVFSVFFVCFIFIFYISIYTHLIEMNQSVYMYMCLVLNMYLYIYSFVFCSF